MLCRYCGDILIDWPSDWLIYRSMVWLIYRSIDWSIVGYILIDLSIYCLIGRSIDWLIDYDIIDHPTKNMQGAWCESNLIPRRTDFLGYLWKSIFLADGKWTRAITSRNWTPKLCIRMANDILKDNTIIWWIGGQCQTISFPWNKDTVKHSTSRPFSSKCSQKILNLATISISYYPVQ